MADDMVGLYKRIVKGLYPKLPCKYSDDLCSVIEACLKVAPTKRPRASALLALKSVRRRLHHDKNHEEEKEKGEIIALKDGLIKTIRCGKDLS